MPSPDYHSLCKRIAKLRRHLLPSQFDPTGSYTEEIYDRTRGFIALVHAEIESFIEQRCLSVAQQNVSRWISKRIPTPVVFSLYSICYSGWSEIGEKPLNLGTPTPHQNIEARLGDSLKQYERVVGDNHGIKEDNLKRLLVPLSIRLKGDIDEDWITNMSNFGGDRGKIVHMSWRANHPPDPKTSRETVGDHLLPGLKTLDELLTALI